MTPQKGDTVRVLTGQWKGHLGVVADVFKSGALWVAITVNREKQKRALYPEEVEVIR